MVTQSAVLTRSFRSKLTVSSLCLHGGVTVVESEASGLLFSLPPFSLSGLFVILFTSHCDSKFRRFFPNCNCRYLPEFICMFTDLLQELMRPQTHSD